MTVDLLAIFTHLDDVELAVGGTLLKMKHLGYRTRPLDVTHGEMGTAVRSKVVQPRPATPRGS